MRDVAHVGLVDAHAEGDGRNDADGIVLEEGVLVGRALGGVHAGVVGQGVDPLLAQELRGAVDLGARQAIDDAALALVARQELRAAASGPGAAATIV